ncbi:hypothetical protein EHQ46_11900 [Leptospira yanagawae]|uniref:Polysaccharide lyase n=1 Tax=Leptospira yanagawae TaxID=293069 RepID=A0ABY2M0E2_9LEPT|nr:DUF6544 family protein [Leptospira yanagawae]TGL20086.1 hypothetical protein EHQ46_11900 [Leptospira yanagawae]
MKFQFPLNRIHCFSQFRFYIFISLLSFCNPLEEQYRVDVERMFGSQQRIETKVLSESDIKSLPKPVQRYLQYTGVLGKPQTTNMRILFDELMYKTPNSEPMVSSSEQYNFFNDPSRFFYMKASMMGVPFRVYHSYANEKASMVVKIVSWIEVVNVDGEELTNTETVTLLNDLCLFAPSALLQNNITWQEEGPLSAKLMYQNGKYKVSAQLMFNEKGELINFISDDRAALQDDGSLRKARWSTPVKEYKEFNGVKVPTYGEAIWNFPEGDFVYGKFFLKNFETNLVSKIEE